MTAPRMDEQARKDAMADAAQLRDFVFRGANLGAGEQYERIAHELSRSSHGATVMLHPEDAARAIFRAVPALREAR